MGKQLLFLAGMTLKKDILLINFLILIKLYIIIAFITYFKKIQIAQTYKLSFK